jgi:hypothetical protein
MFSVAGPLLSEHHTSIQFKCLRNGGFNDSFTPLHIPSDQAPYVGSQDDMPLSWPNTSARLSTYVTSRSILHDYAHNGRG